MPTRVDGALFEAAKTTGSVHSRSAAQQINHWARIGCEFEASSRVSHRDIERVLAGNGSYDALVERGQAVVRATWDERIADNTAGLDLETEFTASGRAWSEADEVGDVRLRGDGAPTPD